MTIYSGEFEDNIRDLLSNLYDYLKLVENPVARQLAGEHSGKERTGAIRGAVLAAIEDLRREDAGGRTSRRNRLYHILLLRYIEEQGTSEVLQRLALSERQYYREHQRALQTISRVIWDKHFAGARAPETTSLVDELEYLSVDRGQASFDAETEILAALRSTAVIARQREIDIRVDGAGAPVHLQVSQPVFRQLMIYLLNDLMAGMPPGGRISIALATERDEPTIAFSGLAAAQDIWQRLGSDRTALALMKSVNARLQYEPGPPRLTLRFQRKVHRVLIVDDNPDTIALFKRYLAKQPYQLLAAREEGEALSIAQGAPLLCVILDVMLPGADGWQILQRFKNHPSTAELPVLICSVLEMEELALSLGADGYLKKPPARDELLATLQEWSG